MSFKELFLEGPTGPVPKANQGGDCYVKAWDYFQNNFKDDLRLVHGLVTGQGPLEGIVYNHAWVEKGNKVIDPSQPRGRQEFPKDLYYKIGKIKTVYKYNREEVAKKAVEYRTYGPWEKKLLKNKY